MYRRSVRAASASARVTTTIAIALAAAAAGCVARPRMCVAPGECGASATCVAGRCQRNKGLPQIQSARRVLVDPVAMAYVGRGADGERDAAPGALPATFTLGRASDAAARLYLRFEVAIPRDATVVEAYLLLHRADVDADPGPIGLHAARVVSRWDPRAVSWALQPAIEDVRAPATFVTAAGRRQVRLDVHDLVARWRAHDPRDQGIAVVAESSTVTGVAFALAPATPIGDASRERSLAAGAGAAPPQLELYVK